MIKRQDLQQKGSVGRSLQIHMLDLHQSVTKHVDSGLTVFQNQIANQRLVFTIFGSHLNKRHFMMDRAKAFQSEYGRDRRRCL